MATTTPNFGWSVPTSTDLVKDGATAIETLGDAIDASLLDLKGGTSGQLLSKNSNSDMDFTWVAAPSSGGMTLIATASPSSATTVSFTSIPSTYTNLLIVWTAETSGGTTPYFSVRCNNDSTGALHPWTSAGFTAGSNLTTYGSSNGSSWGDSYRTAPIGQNNAYKKNGVLWFYDYTSTGSKVGTWMTQADSGNPTLIQGVGAYNGTSAINRIDFIRSDTQTITGTFKLYGVK